MGPSPLPENRWLTEQDLTARTRPMTPAQAQAARGRLEAFINFLIEASISVLTGEERAAFDGCTGLDATPVPLFSRGPPKRAGLCASDPGGGWYVREGDHREREDDKGNPLRKIAWALEATIATMARPPGAPPAHPDLAIGLALARPGEDPGGTGARVLASVPARGYKTGWPGYDRACTQALPGRFHLPARALGYSPVMDDKPGQPGIQANTGGATLAGGTRYRPALPGPASWASRWRTDRCSPAWAAVRRMRWAICRARTQVKTWTLMLCSVQWCIGEKDTTCGSFIWRKENSASDWDRYPAMTSGTGQSS